MLVGLGAVSTTFIAGVENVRRGRGLPIGSLSQWGPSVSASHEKRPVKISREFVPLADLQDLVVRTAWDPIARRRVHRRGESPGCWERHEHLEPIKDFLQASSRSPPRSTSNYVSGAGHQREARQDKRELREQLRRGHPAASESPRG